LSHPAWLLRSLESPEAPHPLSGPASGLDPSVDRVHSAPRANRNLRINFPCRLPAAHGRDTHRERPLMCSETVLFPPKSDIYGFEFQISVKLRVAGAAQPASRAGGLAQSRRCSGATPQWLCDRTMSALPSCRHAHARRNAQTNVAVVGEKRG
jgi:hypothetical protein